MERTQSTAPAESPRPSALAQYGRASTAAIVTGMLREVAERLERHRPDLQLTTVARIAVLQATTMAPPLSAALRQAAPEITQPITRRAYADRLRQIADERDASASAPRVCHICKGAKGTTVDVSHDGTSAQQWKPCGPCHGTGVQGGGI